MPTVLRIEGCRFFFFFFSGDWNEPPHIHVDRGRVSAKFWLERIELARNEGTSAREPGIVVLRLPRERHVTLLEGWPEYFGTSSRR
ncbi:MAG: DUF4160 domain-containing protein [Acetobacteraceae bacterium]|nr:DUF4160 domain-containing protein [Acetobacteraceae bacterium]